MTETLFLPLFGLSMWLTARADRKRSASSFSAMVAAWMLTALTRGIALPFGGLSGLWVWLHHPKKARTAGYAAMIVLAMTVPLAVRNHSLLLLWSPLGTGWPNQIYAASGKRTIEIRMETDGAYWEYGFGSPSMYTKPLAPLSDWEPERSGVVKFSVDLRKGAEDWRAAYERSALRGWARLRLRWENMILVMYGPSWPDNNPEHPFARIANDMRWLWAPLLLLVMIAVAVRRRAMRKRPVLPALIVAWVLFQALSLLAVNEGRYRKPLEGMLIAQALVLLDTL